MQTLRIQLDQWTAIGNSLAFTVTDIDRTSARIVARGQIIGGPEDGASIDRPYDIAVGSDAKVGLITLALIDTRPLDNAMATMASAKFGIYAPPHMPIRFVKEPT